MDDFENIFLLKTTVSPALYRIPNLARSSSPRHAENTRGDIDKKGATLTSE